MKILHIGKLGNMNKYSNGQVDNYSIIDCPNGLTVSEYLDAGWDADVIIADAISTISRALIESMPNLKLIHSEGVAYHGIDLAAAKENQVYVCNCKGMNATAVAEQTLLLMISVLRNVNINDQMVRLGKQIEKKERYMEEGNLYELSDCKIGLIGLGDIGKATARLLQPFNTEVYYYCRHPLMEDKEQELSINYLPLDKLLNTCNMISLHIPVTAQTERMANREFFNQMNKDSYFINTSRGELVDNSALIDAIANGTICMAGLDTLDHEPVKLDHPLLNQDKEIMDKIIFSPHIGGITASSFKRGYEIIWKNIQRIQTGEKPLYIVNE